MIDSCRVTLLILLLMSSFHLHMNSVPLCVCEQVVWRRYALASQTPEKAGMILFYFFNKKNRHRAQLIAILRQYVRSPTGISLHVVFETENVCS